MNKIIMGIVGILSMFLLGGCFNQETNKIVMEDSNFFIRLYLCEDGICPKTFFVGFLISSVFVYFTAPKDVEHFLKLTISAVFGVFGSAFMMLVINYMLAV